MTDDAILTVLIFLFAVLYSSVGHAGATGYLAAMGLMSLEPSVMKPAALVLNVLVASIGTVRFARAGCLPWRVLWPFAVASIPCAFLGGVLTLPASLFKQLIGAMLLIAATKLFVQPVTDKTEECVPPSFWWSLPVGGLVGLVAGLTGTGGGVLLTPVLLFLRWAKTRDAAGVSVAFILLNSISGLAAQAKAVPLLPSSIWLWLAAAGLGGMIGTQLGTRRLAAPVLRRLLGVVLVFAGVKMLFDEFKPKAAPKPTNSASHLVAKVAEQQA